MEFDVLIVGGGLAGASLAVALRGTQRRVAVVEPRAPQRPAGWDQRIYAISPASRAYLDDIGIWAHLDPSRLAPVREMAIFGDVDGHLHFSAYEAGLAELACIVESSHMQVEMWETLRRQHNVSLFSPASARSITPGEQSVAIELDDGRVLRTRLLVAADGANSVVRETLGIAARTTPYNELGVVANFTCERPHDGIARQWFRDDGVLAWLPLPGNRVSMVWSAPDAHAQTLLALDPRALADAVASAGGHALGQLTAESEAAAFALRLMRVDEIVRERVVLIGDAAHTIHPLSGHGINLGFGDAAALAARIAALPAWRDPGELAVLRAYARERAEEPRLLQGVTDALDRLFKTRHPLLRFARNSGMNLTDRLPVLRSALVRYATSGKF
ncbi:UbiH/UbiF family hydroxylase [Pseudazoarcus pumilus]|uniref:Ubiquinone biosynthesis protein UbiH n=1 Tax=Pseudazoarcus pumilus TaxID=2067960 RepID=A0A2I6S4W4_9RHOO|nr:UbiH/UbiF family hydroxylase [Pseudazoarcus pumilus]AUN94291.1 ubiquinone biosynthesis protein UbiH [Pseudazoarcus pumilus]